VNEEWPWLLLDVDPVAPFAAQSPAAVVPLPEDPPCEHAVNRLCMDAASAEVKNAVFKKKRLVIFFIGTSP
jgi:hypothetical protein